MLRDITYRVGRLIYLVPGKYWYGAAGVAVVALLGGIVNTIATAPSTEVKAARLDIAKDPSDAVLKGGGPVSVPPDITKGNVFRKDRNEYNPPKESPAPTRSEGDTLPEVKLLGTIITDDKRIAIVDGTVKEYVKVEIYETPKISGAQYQYLKAKGLNYELKPIGEKELKGQSFLEGEELADSVIDEVKADRIIVSDTKTGQQFMVPLEMKEQEEMKQEKLKTMPVAEPDKPKGVDVSGAKWQNR